MKIALLLLSVGTVAGFRAGFETVQTRSPCRTSTAFYVSSRRTEEAQDRVQKSSRWFPTWFESDQEHVTTSDEQQVDEYLEFLDRRYR
jgi:hypothetical protein